MDTTKKILYINPSVDKFLNPRLWSPEILNQIVGEDVTFMPRLSAMIFAAITPPAYQFRFLDEEVEDIDFEHCDADLVAMTAMTVQIERAYQIADRMRAMGKTVIIGGIHATVLPDEVAAHCDAVMVGEGENTWESMLQDFFQGDGLKKRYAAKDYPVRREFVSPRVDIIHHNRYLMYPLQATKGCPNNCDFCSIRFSSGHRYRMKPVEQVIEEIRAFERYNKGQFFHTLKKSYQFVDDNLYVDREYTMELFRAMKGLNITWSGQGTVNTVNDDEALLAMAESGCRSFSIGFESISDATLREMNKPVYYKVSEYEQAIRKLIRYGIVPSGYFVYGFDHDDVEVFKKTSQYAIDQHLVQAHFSVLTPYPGTSLWERLQNEGRIFTRKWNAYSSLECVFKPTNMSPTDLQAGAFWSAFRASELENIKVQLQNFWDHGPWRHNPIMGFKERLALRLISTKLKNNRAYRKFLKWVASVKNATSFGLVLYLLSVHDLARKVSPAYDPAEKLKTEGADRVSPEEGVDRASPEEGIDRTSPEEGSDRGSPEAEEDAGYGSVHSAGERGRQR
jgi:radical SAM superfamily enzyme YgiQ (UPF0313 family)